MTKQALVIVDVQNDFVNGSLAVPEAAETLPVIRGLARSGAYRVVAATRDWHPADHRSFADEPEYRDYSWPAHCVQGTEGAEYAGGIKDLVTPGWHFAKGQFRDREEYSGAFARSMDMNEALAPELRRKGIEEVDVVGLALDYCVVNTALDLGEQGFHVRVLLDGTRPVSQPQGEAAIDKLRRAGVEVTR